MQQFREIADEYFGDGISFKYLPENALKKALIPAKAKNRQKTHCFDLPELFATMRAIFSRVMRNKNDLFPNRAIIVFY